MDKAKKILLRFIDFFLSIFNVNNLKVEKTTTKPKKKPAPKVEKPTESDTEIKPLPKIEPKSTPQSEDKPKIPTKKPTTTPTTKSSGAVTIDPDYSNRKGYNPNFLSLKLPLPKLSKAMQAKIALTTEGGKKELKYHHYSLVMNGERKLPFFTAVNIDALSYEKLGNVPSRSEIGRDKWYLDPRMPKEVQLPASYYDKNDFDIGHLVRREDTLWGDTLEFAIKANNDTFHLTNAAPQHKDLNRNAKRWLGLENYAIQNARKHGLKITVFTGPVFDDNDGVYNDVKIPDQFWKVIVMIKDDGTPSATGYIVQQNDLIEDIVTRGFMYEQFQTYQVPISEIEDLTDITFGLNDYDPIQKKKTRSLTYEFKPELVDSFDKIIF
jgi:endonuclease G, mitochondrial